MTHHDPHRFCKGGLPLFISLLLALCLFTQGFAVFPHMALAEPTFADELDDREEAASKESYGSTIQEPEDVLPDMRVDASAASAASNAGEETTTDEATATDEAVSTAIEQELTDNVFARSGVSLRSTQMILHYYSLYSDAPFLKPATEYNHDLARMSICMAVCANRPIPYDSDVVLDPDQFLVQYLEDCGFTNLRTDDYDKTPSLYTVATAMGSKQLIDEDGEPFTLIAVGVCGGNYKKEWLSNVTVGSSGRHKGFNSAATMVTDRIFGYIGNNHITGRIKIWIAGFSRAAAVSNLTAANLVDSGFFGNDNIYAYTFATPRTTKQHTSEGYENIFNIVGAMDMIPQMAPAAWGFGHYGNDLVLPGAEYDSNFESKYALVEEGFKEFYDGTTYYNPKVNLSLRLLLGMVEELIPDPDHYDTVPEEAVLSVLEDKSPQNVLRVLRQVTVHMKDDDSTTKALEDQMIEFIGKFAIGLITNMDEFENDNNTGTTSSRIFHEHIEDLYLMWMQVDLTPEELYTNHDSFTYVFAFGDCDFSVEDPDTGEELYRIASVGDKSDVKKLDAASRRKCSLAIESFALPYNDDTVFAIALPHDANYRVRWEATADGYLGAIVVPSSYTIAPSYESYGMSDDVQKGASGVLYEAHGDQLTFGECERRDLASSDAAWILGLSYTKSGWRQTIAQSIMRVCLLLILLRAIVATINRYGSDDKWQIRFILSSIMMLAMVESEVAFWLFAAMPRFRLFWKAIASAAVLLYCLCCRKRGSGRFTGIFAALVFFAAGDMAINFWFLPGLALFACAHLFLIWLFQSINPINKRTWMWWTLLSVGLIVVFVLLSGDYAMSIRACTIMYVLILLLLLMTSSWQGGNLRLGASFLVVSDCLFAYYFVHPEWPYVHMAYIALYYLSQMIICRSLLDEDVFIAYGGRLKLPKVLRELLSGAVKQLEDSRPGQLSS